MKVKELIERLGRLDKDKDIVFYSFIESGRGGSWIKVDNCYIEDEENNYLLGINGDVDEDGDSE